MPKGCEANGSAIVRVTARLAESTTLMEALDLFVIQTSPFARTASARGAVPTTIVASFALVPALKALTELWSWLTTQTRSTPVGRSSKAMLVEIRRAVGRQRVVHELREGRRSEACRRRRGP